MATPSVVNSNNTSTSTSTSTSTTNSAFQFPREYFFPAFFTRQTNLTTHHAQLSKWSSLILSYARHHHIHRLSISSSTDSEIFYNKTIERRLGIADVKDVLDFMRRDGRVEFLEGGAEGFGIGSMMAAAAAASGGASGGGGGDVVLVYWRRPEEWADLIDEYIEETAQRGSVLTIYELTNGEATRRTEFHGLDREILLKALNILVKKGKAQIFGSEDSLGVKFF